MFKSYFDNTQIALLVTGALFFLLSIITHLKNKEKFSIIFLGLTAICIFSFSALLDPFLNLWDERFHALVAKNMMKHPFKPTLYDDPIVNMNYDSWINYHIWLHKPPLFLWQIALSFKIFGISEFTLRLPSVILGVILVLITYRSGKLIVNKQVGYVASLLTISTIYLLELIAGNQGLDHNDFSFLVYISLSIWAFIEYYFSGKKKWIYLIGLFSGMAILCKWLVGLLVYFGWIVLKIKQNKLKLTEYKDIFVSLLVTVFVFLPWQIFILIQYPAEAMKAYKYFHIHFSEPLEGHGGDFWCHFDIFNIIYGKIASFLIIPGFIVLFKKANNKNLVFSLYSMVFIVYLFFSLAATKMSSFTIIVAMIIFIAFASLFNYIVNYINQSINKDYIKHLVFSLLLISIVLLRFDVELLQEKHTFWKQNNVWRKMLIHNKQVFKSLKLPTNTVLFNVINNHYIEAMFYTDFPTYSFIPSFEQYQEIKNKKRNIAIFIGNNPSIPDYLKNDTTVIYLNQEIQGYE